VAPLPRVRPRTFVWEEYYVSMDLFPDAEHRGDRGEAEAQMIDPELSPAADELARARRDFIYRNFAEQFRGRYRLTAGPRADRFLAGKEAGARAVAAAEKVFDSANRSNRTKKSSQ